MKLWNVVWQLLVLALLIGCNTEPVTRQVQAQADVVTVTPVVPTVTATAVASPTPSPQPPATGTPVSSLDTCPVTRPPKPAFRPPEPYSQYAPWGYFWHGTKSLWTAIPGDGVWAALPHNPEGYSQKIFWWREGYVITEEPEPGLTVTGRRLDGPAPPLMAWPATNAFAADIQSAMLVGVDFPTLGCWEVTGRYQDHELSFIVWIAP